MAAPTAYLDKVRKWFTPLFQRDDALSTLSESEGTAVQGRVDSRGALWTTDAGGNMSTDSSAAAEASAIVKASAGTLYQLVGYNAKTSAQFIQLHDSSTVPADTSVPALVFKVAASTAFDLTLPKGFPLTAGIVVCNSSTYATKTMGSADCFFTAIYE